MINFGLSGMLEDVLYYSFLVVKLENSKEYEEIGGYMIDLIKDKMIFFVMNILIFGFIVLSNKIVEYFDLKNIDDFIMDGLFFEKVLFGGFY